MTDINQDEVAFRVWELSQAIEVAAVEGNWALAASLAETRSPLLMTFAPEQSAEALAAAAWLRFHARGNGVALWALLGNGVLYAAYLTLTLGR